MPLSINIDELVLNTIVSLIKINTLNRDIIHISIFTFSRGVKKFYSINIRGNENYRIIRVIPSLYLMCFQVETV